MKLFVQLLVVVAVLANDALADCQSGTVVGPCVCTVDSTEQVGLECTAVTDGADISAALNRIQVGELSSLDIRESPELTTLPDDAFGSTAVLNIRFYNTGLDSLSAAVFSGPTSRSLLTLYIKRCTNYKKIDSKMVSVLRGLKDLYVSSTGVTTLDEPLSSNTLEYIDLSSNEITQIIDDYFAAVPKLVVALLNFNQLATHSFKGTTQSLAAPGGDLYLDLGWNNIKEGLVGLTFSDAAPRELILSGNGITELTQEAFDGLLTQMGTQYEAAYILMDNNSLKCGCDLAWVMDHPYRSVLVEAQCDNGQLVDNLKPSDFQDCP